jgi:sugar lactone lactonase YvrE
MSELRTLIDGFTLGESPRWHDGRLWFCDWGAQRVMAVDLDGNGEVMAQLSSFPFCIDWLPDGRLLIVSASDGLLLRMEPDGSLVTHADLSALSDKPWNDIVVDGRGTAYIGNLGFEFPGGDFAPGTIALVTADGSATEVADGVAFPNGMVVTPDNATLILAESYGNKLTAFDIAPDGTLSNRRVWAELGEGVPPDGICLDAEGAVWYAEVPNKRCVRVREGGEVLQTLQLDRGCFACALGGADDQTLYIVAAEFPPNFETPTGQVVSAEAPAPRAPSPGEAG